MSRRNKLKKFSELNQLPNVYQCFDPTKPVLQGQDEQIVELKGKWRSDHFKKEGTLVLELACGGGEYAVGMGRMYPEKMFIGVDVKGARIWKGATLAHNSEMNHVAFLRTRIEIIAQFFKEEEIDEIWITFPDPFSRDSKVNRRLTSMNFIKEYRKFLKKGGLIHLKTDDLGLYEFTLETIRENEGVTLVYEKDDIYSGPLHTSELELKTHYEVQHLANLKTIKYIQFTI